jgi:hypothetical protein
MAALRREIDDLEDYCIAHVHSGAPSAIAAEASQRVQAILSYRMRIVNVGENETRLPEAVDSLCAQRKWRAHTLRGRSQCFER